MHMRINGQSSTKEKLLIILCCAFIGIAILGCASSIWVRNTYGELLIATTNESFRNFFANKRSLFLMQVCIPSFFVFISFVFIGIVVLRKRLGGKIKYIFAYSIGLALLLLIIGGCVLNAGEYFERYIHLKDTQWYDQDRVVIHALGMIEEDTYTNSKEALEKSYNMGNTIFECDMILTADNQLVACHDWNSGFQEGFSDENIPTKEAFMDAKIYGEYTPLSIVEIVSFMKTHPEVYVITDTKNGEEEYFQKQFQEIVDAAIDAECEEVLSRFVIQIYHPYMYADIEEIYHFENYIYTLYQRGYRGDLQEMEEYAFFCLQNGIDVITMNEEYYSDELKEVCDRYGLQLFVHTVNDETRKAMFLEKNIGVYTDSHNNG